MDVPSLNPNKPIRIGLSCTLLEPACNKGHIDGISNYTQALLEQLLSQGVTVCPLSFPPLFSKKPISKLSTWFPYSFERTSLQDSFFKFRTDIALYHATDFRVTRMTCPIVATLHDALPLRFPSWYKPGLRVLKRSILKNSARKADHVIALSNAVVDDLVQYFGIDENRVSVVPCGVDDDWFHSPGYQKIKATLLKYALPEGYFLFVGTLQPRKNIERILDAYLLLPLRLRQKHALVIVGQRGWSDEPILRRIKAAKEAGHKVHWLCQIRAKHELKDLYYAAHAFVFPSLYEGFGIPILEAFACHVPVITSNSGALAEVAEDAALLVSAQCSHEISSYMRMLCEDESLREQYINRGYQRALNFTWQACATKTMAIYKMLL